ncbi:hypothetical protein HU200_022391 [Digitaria exilis]|uniref:Wings apart-like protein C-terminal domain-containing protein n=1 Tax=Digitaria exilis TaxID=1010633 RepID=A0A835C7U4_9POAL|nr:hypothetical protein HU200_022391 [Digitaria exilis]
MIVRTYGRRSRSFSDGGGGVSSSHDAFDFDADGDVLGSSASQPLPLPPPSQESSSTWEFDEDPPPSPPQPRPEARRRGARRGGGGWELAEPAVLAPTATLMEAEEYGEMMESMDEVSFALDGLRPAAQRRTRRASLHALLGICASAERRRVLRVQGLLQQIIDAILVLDIDDPPCAIAAGALLFVLASDVQDNNLLDSETCVHFLLKLLNPPVKNVVDAKAPSIGSKLLGISKFQMLNGPNKDSDSSSDDILSKVEEILLSCKEIKPLDKDDKRTSRPELCSKWLALLTMEKACLSAVALEETSDMVARIGGNFKETLRQSGGLDSIFSVMVNCHSELERLVKDASTTAMELKEGTPLQSAALLLKCFKILENATFLSENNKTHLLRMNRKLSPKCSLPFIGVVINTIELLSALSLLQNSSTVSRKADPKSTKVSNGGCSAGCRGAPLLNHHDKCKNSTGNNPLLNQRRQNCSSSKSEVSHITISSSSDACHSQRTLDCSPSVSSNGASSGSFVERHSNGVGLKLNVRKDRSKANPIRGSSGWISIKAQSSDGNSREMAKKRRLSENADMGLSNGGDDPFAFDDIDQEPSNWDVFGPKRKSPQKRAKRANGKMLDDCETAVIGSPESCQPDDIYQSGASSDSRAEDESTLLEDCLLASVKVLMNLANDNPSGCEQIASCGGINTMASLIIKHFPSFDFSMNNNNQLKDRVSSGQHVNVNEDLSSSQNMARQVKTKHLRDHELDFLVAILGLLVNLVEKDSLNRVRLANARVSVSTSQNQDSEETQRDVIPLLCSIFLASQGAGETAEAISPDDEESLLQGAREAEMMIVEAYAALVLAFLSTESMKVRGAVTSCLPDNSLKILVPVLEKFVTFHLQLNMMSRETHSSVTEVIERCRLS